MIPTSNVREDGGVALLVRDGVLRVRGVSLWVVGVVLPGVGEAALPGGGLLLVDDRALWPH
jgi:hypothetical protein